MQERRKHNDNRYSRRRTDTSHVEPDSSPDLLTTIIAAEVASETFSAPDPTPCDTPSFDSLSADTCSPSSDFGGFDGGSSGGGGADSSW